MDLNLARIEMEMFMADERHRDTNYVQILERARAYQEKHPFSPKKVEKEVNTVLTPAQSRLPRGDDCRLERGGCARPNHSQLADVPCGWSAERDSLGSPWRRAQK